MTLLYLDSPSPLTPHEQLLFGGFVVGLFILYVLRSIPFFGTLYYHITTMLIIIFTFGMVNYTKKNIKEWWNKD
jgi:hypothetical protein